MEELETADICEASSSVLSEHEEADISFRDNPISSNPRRHTLSPYGSRPGIPPRPPSSRGARDPSDDVGTGVEWERFGNSVLNAGDSDDESIDDTSLGASASSMSASSSLVQDCAPVGNDYLRRKTMESWLADEEGDSYSQDQDMKCDDMEQEVDDKEEEDTSDLCEEDSSARAWVEEGRVGGAHSSSCSDAAIAASVSTAARVSTSNCVIKEFTAHKQEVCGLKWSFDEKQLASGGNDNKLFVWNMAGTGQDESQRRSGTIAPEHRFADHTAAVKAIAWSPHQVRGVVA
jgi:hypothetical protein